jgi:hypothetical protein
MDNAMCVQIAVLINTNNVMAVHLQTVEDEAATVKLAAAA